MQGIFTKSKLLVKGFKIAIVNHFRIFPLGEHSYIRAEHDYARWSYNVKTLYKVKGFKALPSLYIHENTDMLHIYEVTDRSQGEPVGVIRYHFGTWEMLDSHDNYFKIDPADDIIKEILLLRRVPQVITDSQGRVCGQIKKISPFFMPFFYSYVIDFSGEGFAPVDKRLALAGFILFIFAHERVASLEKIKYYIATRFGFKPHNKIFAIKKSKLSRRLRR